MRAAHYATLHRLQSRKDRHCNRNEIDSLILANNAPQLMAQNSAPPFQSFQDNALNSATTVVLGYYLIQIIFLEKNLVANSISFALIAEIHYIFAHKHIECNTLDYHSIGISLTLNQNLNAVLVCA